MWIFDCLCTLLYNVQSFELVCFFFASPFLLFSVRARLYLFIYFFHHGFYIRINWMLCRDELVYKYLIFRRFIYVCLSFFFCSSTIFFCSSLLCSLPPPARFPTHQQLSVNRLPIII